MTRRSAALEILRRYRVCIACLEPIAIGQNTTRWTDAHLGWVEIDEHCREAWVRDGREPINTWAYGKFREAARRMERRQ